MLGRAGGGRTDRRADGRAADTRIVRGAAGQASGRMGEWTGGRMDVVLMIANDNKDWPKSIVKAFS